MSGQLPAPAFHAPSNARRETLADTVQRLRLNWPQLHYSASLLDALDSALSIYPAERPQTVEQMRARLDTARPAAGVPVDAAWTGAPVLSDAAPSSPAPQPAPPQNLDATMSFAPDPAPLEASGVARIDDDLEREAPNPRRIVLWSGTVLLLALLLTGLYEFRHERQVARVLDVLGISNGMDAGDQAGVYASAVGPTDQVTPGIAANTEAATPMPPDPTAADSPMNATAPDSPASTPFAANAGAAATAP